MYVLKRGKTLLLIDAGHSHCLWLWNIKFINSRVYNYLCTYLVYHYAYVQLAKEYANK